MTKEAELIKKIKDVLPEGLNINYGELQDAAEGLILLSGYNPEIQTKEDKKAKRESVMNDLADRIIESKDKFQFSSSLDDILLGISTNVLSNKKNIGGLTIKTELVNEIQNPVMSFSVNGNDFDVRFGLLVQKDEHAIEDHVKHGRLGISEIKVNGDTIKSNMREKISDKTFDLIKDRSLVRLLKTANEQSFGGEFTAETIDEKREESERLLKKSFSELLFATLTRESDITLKSKKTDEFVEMKRFVEEDKKKAVEPKKVKPV